MIKLNEKYVINNGQGSIVFTEGNKETVNALYTIKGNKSEGKINGKLDGNILKGTFHVDAAAGLIEFIFNSNGFDAKWKQGLEPGPMRGKWTAKLNIVNNNSINDFNNVSLYNLCSDFQGDDLLKLDDLLNELVFEGTFKVEKYNFDLIDIIQQVNTTYGELCWAAYRDTIEDIKSFEYYSSKWGELLENLKERATSSKEFRVLGDFIHSQYRPFFDSEKAIAFAEQAYYNGIKLANTYDDISWFTSSTLIGEFYYNDELLNTAGEKAIQLVEDPNDYIGICFDDNSNLTYNEEIMREAIEKIKKVVDEIDSELLNFLKDDLSDNDFEDLLDD